MEEYRQRFEDNIMQFTTNKSANYDQTPTFPDFVRYLITTRKIFETHWRPLTRLLQPCDFHYNFIGKIETIEDDSRYIFQNIFGDPSFTLPRKNWADKKHDGRKYTKSLQEYYSELTPQELTDVIDMYKDDFDVFGYEKIVPIS